MTDEATQQGASVHDRLVALLGGEEPTNEPEQKAAPEAEEEAEEPDNSAPESKESTEEEETEDAQEADEPRTIELSDVAKYLGVDADLLDVDEDGSISIKTKVDGQEGRAKLKDLHKSYQLEGHLNKQNMEVAEQRKALQAKMAEAEQAAQQRFQAADDLIQIAQNQLNGEYTAIDWNQLRATDSGEYAAKFADFQQRQAVLNQAYQRIQTERERNARQNQEAMQQRLAEESTRLLEAIPEWKNAETAKKERDALREFGRARGYTDAELANIADHRAVSVLRDAYLYRQLMNKKADVEKKVKAAPKLAKPGQPPSKQERQEADQKKLRQTIKKSGGKQGVTEWLLANGKV